MAEATNEGEALPFDHNEAIAAQADEARYQNLMAMHQGIDRRIALKRLELKEITDNRKDIRRKLSDAGYPNDLVDETLADVTTPNRKLLQREEVRGKMRRWRGLPVGGDPQAKLDLTPEFTKGELQYEADGFQAGVNGLDRDPPEGTPPEFYNAFEKGWLEGQGRLAWAMDEENRDKARIEAAKAAPPAPEPEPEPDLEPAAVAKAARKLKGDAKFMDRTQPADGDQAAAA